MKHSELIEDFMSDLKTMSEVINKRLWYVNPQDIEDYLRIYGEHYEILIEQDYLLEDIEELKIEKYRGRNDIKIDEFDKGYLAGYEEAMQMMIYQKREKLKFLE